jgi:excisionase family DNA binding protein
MATNAKKKPKASKANSNGVPPSAEGVLTLAEAAAFLRVSEEGLRKDADDGRLPGRLVGGEWRFVRQALLEWLSAATPPPPFHPVKLTGRTKTSS